MDCQQSVDVGVTSTFRPHLARAGVACCFVVLLRLILSLTRGRSAGCCASGASAPGGT